MKSVYLIGGIVIFLIVVAGWYMMNSGKLTGNVTKSDTKQVELQTTDGNIVIELYSDKPITAGNFETLVNKGYYDGVIFHRIIDGFMIQGGDPTGTGMGGPGYKIKDEFAGGVSDKNNKYTISMANAGPNTGGSQFFINLIDNNFLDGKHAVFGIVVSGMEVVDKIGHVETDTADRPLKEVKIIKARVL
jgi:peptidylprolyl isomerase